MVVILTVECGIMVTLMVFGVNIYNMKYRLRKFTEAIESNKFTEVISEIKSLIESTIKNSGGEFKTFVSSFLKNPDDVKIEGLINESDIYDFYLKFRNQIDECLNEIKYYDNIPSEIGVFGLYDYIIKGTQESIKEFVKSLSE
jgi:hypothetical protein